MNSDSIVENELNTPLDSYFMEQMEGDEIICEELGLPAGSTFEKSGIDIWSFIMGIIGSALVLVLLQILVWAALHDRGAS